MADIALRPYESTEKLGAAPEVTPDFTSVQIRGKTGEQLAGTFFHLSERAAQYYDYGTKMWAEDEARKALPDYLLVYGDWQKTAGKYDPVTDQKNLIESMDILKTELLVNAKSALSKQYLKRNLDQYEKHFITTGSEYSTAQFHTKAASGMDTSRDSAVGIAATLPIDQQQPLYDNAMGDSDSTAQGVLGDVQYEKLRKVADDRYWTNVINTKMTSNDRDVIKELTENAAKYKKLLPPEQYDNFEKALKAANKLQGDEAEHDILDSLGKAVDAPAVEREVFFKEAEEKLRNYGKQRLLKPEDRTKYQNMIRDYREGKDQPTNYNVFLDAKVGLYNGTFTVDDIKRMGGINAKDKGELITTWWQVDKHTKALLTAADRQVAAVRRAELGKMLDNAKQEIMIGALTDSEKRIRQSMFSQYAEQAWTNFKSGGDSWDFQRNNLYKFQGQGEVPFIVIKGSYQGVPRVTGDVDNLKTWVPYLVEKGRVKEANTLSDQLKKAELILRNREAQNAARSAEPERKTAR